MMHFLLAIICLGVSFTAGVEGKIKNGHYHEGGKDVGVPSDFFSFRTRPDFLAPRWNITVYDRKALSPGYIFVAPYKQLSVTDRGEAWIGPHIYDQDGELVWSGAPTFDHYKAFDMRLATINGTDMLTAIYPHINAALVMNKHYEVLETVVHSSEWKYSNMHDFNVVEDGTRALVLTKDDAIRLSREQSMAVGFDGKCLVRGDGMKYLDITSLPPKVLMQFNGTDHIGLDETYMGKDSDPIDIKCTDAEKWDIHHFNSIDLLPDGDFLVSAKATSTLYKISHTSGEIVWRCGGKRSDFDFDTGARFNNQHHARVHSQNKTHIVISLFDNAVGPGSEPYPPRGSSAGLLLSLEVDAMRVHLLGEYLRPDGEYTRKRGSAHLQPNGNFFVGYADDILVSEHAPDGRLLMEGRVLPALDSYRSYKFSWTGEPLEPPSVYSAAFGSGNDAYTMTYVSWNGATEVKMWYLFEVDAETGHEKLIGHKKKSGFETEFVHEGYNKYVVAEARDRRGKSLGKSRPVRTIAPLNRTVDPLASFSIDESTDLKHDVDSQSSSTPEPATETVTVTHIAQASQSSKVNESVADTGSASQIPDLSELQETTGSTSIQKDQIIALVSALSGFFACATVCVLIWVVRFYSSKPWWRRAEGTRYEALPVDNQEEAGDDDEDEIELRRQCSI